MSMVSLTYAAAIRERVVPSRRSMTPAQIARACDGDDSMLEELVGAILPSIRFEVTAGLRRRARLQARDARQDVDDFVQDVMVHLLADDGRRLRAWRPERGRSLQSFVRLLARHRLVRVLEGFRGNPWQGDASDDPESAAPPTAPASATFDRVLSRQQLRRLLDRLHARFNERSMRLFELLYVEQRSVAEVCEQTGMTRAAVDQWNVRLRRLVRHMSESLDREQPRGRGLDPRPRTEGAR